MTIATEGRVMNAETEMTNHSREDQVHAVRRNEMRDNSALLSLMNSSGVERLALAATLDHLGTAGRVSEMEKRAARALIQRQEAENEANRRTGRKKDGQYCPHPGR